MLSVHLPLDAAQRLEHTVRVLQVRAALGGPHALAAGDVNERPGHAAWQAFADAGMRDLGPGSGPTFPAGDPDRRIDGVFGTDELAVRSYEVVSAPGVERASDHRPVLVTVGVPTD